jgi:undecaprenyl diphosphate synthase
MELLVSTINKEIKKLMENNVRLNAIGDLEMLPKKCYKELMAAIEKTSVNTWFNLTLALSYGSRREIMQAAQKVAAKVLKRRTESCRY